MPHLAGGSNKTCADHRFGYLCAHCEDGYSGESGWMPFAICDMCFWLGLSLILVLVAWLAEWDNKCAEVSE